MVDEQESKHLVASVYRDALSPAAQEVGKALAGVVRAALSPASLVVTSIDEAFAFAQERVKERFQRWRVPPERVIAPTAEIAEPVVRMLRFANQDQTLRDLYLNLLARSMDASTQAATHPAFADVLRQLSPLEARLLSALPAKQMSIPLIEVRRALPGAAFITVRKHIAGFSTEPGIQSEVPTSAVDSLARVGIVAIHTDQAVADQALYEPLLRSPESLAAQALVTKDGGTVALHRYLAEITAFGAAFLGAIADAPPEPRDDASAPSDA